ncbi:DNA gyrase inhibitor YacG [Pseudoruegeria aquimaris]|uniref:DNA gyrase inhibitor YacG n=1 Tax=Pseudoruegeria aquimaris TaxID=393663 RepID=A0A1Y5T4G9_9RHOB|nr:DNA gyrase inhibitor YacG [Pseudoruegeria aquimaris]SLN52152.1 DNA gyrase inhibitor YacG [Pseudoruegeria aquimaris]
MSCPICKKESARAYRPFCSKRCADVDLGRWLSESYSIPAAAEDEPETASDEENEPGRNLH